MPSTAVGAGVHRGGGYPSIPAPKPTYNMQTLTPAARWGRWQEQVDAKLRDVADWRLWHNNTDTPLLEVDARDVRQKWARPGYVPPMHPHWHRPADMRPEVPSRCCGDACCAEFWGIATHLGLCAPAAGASGM